jgi:hypothetical protein
MSTENQNSNSNIYIAFVTTISLCINIFFFFKYIELQKEIDKINAGFSTSDNLKSTDALTPATPAPDSAVQWHE